MTKQIFFANQKDVALKYCIYARKSMEQEERQALSIESQLKEMRVIVDRENLQVASVKFEAHSAKNSGQRQVFLEMISDITEGKYNAILTWNPDRLSRNAGDLGVLVDLMDKGSLLEIRTYNQIFSNSPNEKFLLMILCSQAKLENDNKGVNVRRGLRASAQKGYWPCSNPPLGYLKSKIKGEEGIVHLEKEKAHFIKKAFQKIAYEKYSTYMVHDWLKKAGMTTCTGKPMSYSLVQSMLHNRFYYGDFEFPRRSGKIYKGIHETVISKKLFEDAEEAIAKVQRKKKFRLSKTAPFGFLRMIRCGTCGSRITAEEKYQMLKKTGEEVVYRYYICSRSRDKRCRERYISELQLMSEFYRILDTVTIDEIGMKEMFEMEMDKWYKVHAFLEGKPVQERSKEKREYDLREYAKIIFKEGRTEEQREILRFVSDRLLLKDKKIYIDKIPT